MNLGEKDMKQLEAIDKIVPLVVPQIVGVFDNGIYFDLYTVTYDSLDRTDKSKIL